MNISSCAASVMHNEVTYIVYMRDRVRPQNKEAGICYRTPPFSVSFMAMYWLLYDVKNSHAVVVYEFLKLKVKVI